MKEINKIVFITTHKEFSNILRLSYKKSDKLKPLFDRHKVENFKNSKLIKYNKRYIIKIDDSDYLDIALGEKKNILMEIDYFDQLIHEKNHDAKIPKLFKATLIILDESDQINFDVFCEIKEKENLDILNLLMSKNNYEITNESEIKTWDNKIYLNAFYKKNKKLSKVVKF